MAVRVIHAVMRFLVLSAALLSDADLGKGTISTFARLDTFMATTLTCFGVDGSEKVDNYRQKLYNGTLPIYLKVAFDQIIQKVGGYVKDLCSQKLTVLSL